MTASDIALVADGALTLRAHPDSRDAIESWLPKSVRPLDSDLVRQSPEARRTALISIEPLTAVDRSSPNGEAGDERPTLMLGGVRAYVDDDRASLGAARLRGDVDLRLRTARVAVSNTAPVVEVHGGLTLAAALLLARIGRALVHAAAVVDDENRGWLLVGDSHSGKTTTCATLIAAGWRFTADDQVVLSATPEELIVEGWPREAHLDSGWRDGRVTSSREPADLTALRSGAWAPSAKLHGVLFPSVAADQPTAGTPIDAADALGRLIRQSPWLLADRAVAAETLALLSRVASTSCVALSLGRDSYARGARLADVIRSSALAR